MLPFGSGSSLTWKIVHVKKIEPDEIQRTTLSYWVTVELKASASHYHSCVFNMIHQVKCVQEKELCWHIILYKLALPILLPHFNIALHYFSLSPSREFSFDLLFVVNCVPQHDAHGSFVVCQHTRNASSTSQICTGKIIRRWGPRWWQRRVRQWKSSTVQTKEAVQD